jgi:hypothetical protein
VIDAGELVDSRVVIPLEGRRDLKGGIGKLLLSRLRPGLRLPEHLL